MRWLGLRVKYLGNSSDEKLRPMLAAFDLADKALDKEGLDDDPGIWNRIESIARRARVPIEPVVLDLKVENEKAYVRDLTQISAERELECLRSVIARLDALWISSAEQALQRNRSTLAVVGIKKLLAADGWLTQLRSRGYEIQES